MLWVGLLVVALGAVGTALGTARFEWAERSVPNPVAVGGPAGDAILLAARVGDVAFLPVLVGTLGAVAFRFSRSSGVERQQLKWFAYAVALLLGGLAAAAVSELTGKELLGNIGWNLFLVSLLVGMPLAIAVSVLRYRLYDIDLVIRRTLTYGSLSAALAATYLGSVLLAGLAVGESDLAVAASTLGVAAVFRPARSQIQAVVDRRFYRRRFDTAQTVESFGARLRQEVDLESVAGDLRTVVRDTVAPTHLSLWLRGAP